VVALGTIIPAAAESRRFGQPARLYGLAGHRSSCDA
jgi:hypothetical protein